MADELPIHDTTKMPIDTGNTIVPIACTAISATAENNTIATKKKTIDRRA